MADKKTLTGLLNTRLSRRNFLRAAALAGTAVGAQALLAGCGGGATPEPEAEPDEPMPEATAAPAEAVTLRFVTNHGESNLPLFEEVVANFHDANDNIDVELLDIVGAEFYDSINAQGVAGDLPDVWYTRTFDVPVYANKGWTVNLQPFIDGESAEVDVDDFWPAEVKQMEWKGDLYALPYDFSNVGIYYNKSMFDDAGIDYPTDDWTFQDLADLAVRFVEQDGDGNFTKWGMTAYFWNWVFHGLLYGWGGEVFSDDFSECVIASPENQACLEFWEGMRKDGVYPEAGAMPEGVNPFAAGLVPMMYQGSWATVQMRSLVEDAFDFDCVALPLSPDGNGCIGAAGGAWGVASSSDHVEEAWEFNKFLTNTESQIVLISKPLRSIPGRQSAVPAWEEEAAKGSMPPENVGTFARQMSRAYDVAYPAYWQDYDQAWGNIVGPFFDGTAGQSAETVLQELEDEVNRIIALG